MQTRNSTNGEGLTWAEWHAAATLEDKPCCTDAYNQCNLGKCPLLEAWRAGEDPTEYRAALETARTSGRDVRMCGVVYRVQPDGSFKHSWPEPEPEAVLCGVVWVTERDGSVYAIHGGEVKQDQLDRERARGLGITPNCPHCGHNMWVYQLSTGGTIACHRHGWNAFGSSK